MQKWRSVEERKEKSVTTEKQAPVRMPAVLEALIQKVGVANMPWLRGIAGAIGYDIAVAASSDPPSDSPLWLITHATNLSVRNTLGDGVTTIGLPIGSVLLEDVQDVEGIRVVVEERLGGNPPLLVLFLPSSFNTRYPRCRGVMNRDAYGMRSISVEKAVKGQAQLFLVTSGGTVVSMFTHQGPSSTSWETRSLRVLEGVYERRDDALGREFSPVSPPPALTVGERLDFARIQSKLALHYGGAFLADILVQEKQKRQGGDLNRRQTDLQHHMARWYKSRRNVKVAAFLQGRRAFPATRFPEEVSGKNCFLLGPVYMHPGVYHPTRLVGHNSIHHRIPRTLASKLRKEAFVPIFAFLEMASGGVRAGVAAGRFYRKVVGSGQWSPLPQYHEDCLGDLSDMAMLFPQGADSLRPAGVDFVVRRLVARVEDAYSRINVMSPASINPAGLIPLGKLRKLTEKARYESAETRVL